MRRRLLLAGLALAVGACASVNGRTPTHTKFRNDSERLEWLGTQMKPLMGEPAARLKDVDELKCRLKDSDGRKVVHVCRVYWPDGWGIGSLKAKYVDGVLEDWNAEP